MDPAPDADQDGLPDADESALGTNPNDADSDDDGLTDGDEVYVYLTNPLGPDTDDDGWSDGDEIAQGFDPNNPASYPPTTTLYIKSAPPDTHGSKLFTDSSYFAHTVNGYDHTHHHTFGADTCILFDGIKDSIKVPAHDDWNFGTDDFTIDFWLYFITPQYYDGIFSTLKTYGGTSPKPGYMWEIFGGTLQFYAQNATGWMSTGIFPAANTWYHLAVVRSGDIISVYLNGERKTYKDCTGKSFNSSNDGLVLGRLYTSTDNYYAHCYLNEIRVTKGEALWIGDFTPPNPPVKPWP